METVRIEYVLEEGSKYWIVSRRTGTPMGVTPAFAREVMAGNNVIGVEDMPIPFENSLGTYLILKTQGGRYIGEFAHYSPEPKNARVVWKALGLS